MDEAERAAMRRRWQSRRTIDDALSLAFEVPGMLAALDAAEAERNLARRERDAARAEVARLRESLDGLNAELRDLLLLPPDEDGVLMPMPIARGLARMAGHITAALAAADPKGEQ